MLLKRSRGLVLPLAAIQMPLSAFPLHINFGSSTDSFKAFGYHIKTAFAIPLKKRAAFITYTITALRTTVGNPIVTGTSANGAGNLSHDSFHLSADFLFIFPIILQNIHNASHKLDLIKGILFSIIS
jgi:hypothetical protein